MEITLQALSFLIIAVAFIILVVFVIKFIKKVHHSLMILDDTLKAVQRRISVIDNQIVPLLADLQKTVQTYDSLGKSLEDLSRETLAFSKDINVKIKTTENLFYAVKEAGDTVKDVTELTRPAVSELAVQVASMAKGLKTSLELISNNLLSKGGKNHELR